MENLLSKTEMETIINGDHSNIFSVLGIHKDKGSKEVFIRAYIPHAVSVEVLKYDDSSVGFMHKLDDRGFFQINLGAIENFPYRFRVENDNGHKYIKEDEYRFPAVLGDIDVYLLAEGNHLEMYKKLGAHPMEMNGIKGVGFAVWAPNAKRVSVVGAFNNWDGRAHVMRKHPSCGVWDIFIPNIGEGEFYKYEVKTQEDYILSKSDPVGFYAEKRPSTASIVYDINKYQWSDENWMKYREQANSFDKPMSIYEVHLGSWRRKENNEFLTYRELADTLVPYVVNMGFTHVEFLPLCEHPLDCSWGYQVVGMFAPTSRFGTPDDLRYLIDKFHECGIGVIMDWVPAHFPKDGHGMNEFDGTHLYEHADP
ncbi:MAG: 1,4-alpha-glucan branching enzyme, partial [Alphaproteobacteria bacterium]|nr:1,4-alpha-glucan branching enzyme [Alphaproteobacteria bacterium]